MGIQEDLNIFDDEPKPDVEKPSGNRRETLEEFINKQLSKVSTSVDMIDDMLEMLNEELEEAKKSKRVSVNAKAELVKAISMLLGQKISFVEKSIKMKQQENLLVSMDGGEEDKFSPKALSEFMYAMFHANKK